MVGLQKSSGNEKLYAMVLISFQWNCKQTVAIINFNKIGGLVLLLTCLIPLVSFYTPIKTSENRDIEREQWQQNVQQNYNPFCTTVSNSLISSIM